MVNGQFPANLAHRRIREDQARHRADGQFVLHRHQPRLYQLAGSGSGNRKPEDTAAPADNEFDHAFDFTIDDGTVAVAEGSSVDDDAVTEAGARKFGRARKSE